MAKKMATLVGINYAGCGKIPELLGCINDATAMHDLLISRFGFQPEDTALITDDPSSTRIPDNKNIMDALSSMVARAQPGDTLFFHFSGHGLQLPSQADPNIFEQSIVPTDCNLITNMDFRRLVDRLPTGASLTIFSDSCHSGGLIDRETEQIGPNLNPTRSRAIVRNRAIPVEVFLDHVSDLSGLESTDVGEQMKKLFGDEASPDFTMPPPRRTRGGRVRAIAPPDDGILLSGCESTQESADIDPAPGGPDKCHGAFTYTVHRVVKENPDKDISYKDIVLGARKLMSGKYAQNACLYCSDENLDQPFLKRQRQLKYSPNVNNNNNFSAILIWFS